MTCFAFAEHVKKVYNLEPIHMFLSGASAPYVSVICSALSYLSTVKGAENYEKTDRNICQMKTNMKHDHVEYTKHNIEWVRV